MTVNKTLVSCIGSSISLNFSRLKNRSTVIQLTFEDETMGSDLIHRCYVAKQLEYKTTVMLPKRISRRKRKDTSFLTPVMIGIVLMVSGFAVLAVIALAAWGFQTNQVNKKLRNQIDNVNKNKKLSS